MWTGTSNKNQRVCIFCLSSNRDGGRIGQQEKESCNKKDILHFTQEWGSTWFADKTEPISHSKRSQRLREEIGDSPTIFKITLFLWCINCHLHHSWRSYDIHSNSYEETDFHTIGLYQCQCLFLHRNGLQTRNLYFVCQGFTRVMFMHKSTCVLRGLRVFPSSVKADRSMENVILIVMCMLSWFYREATLEEQNGLKCHLCWLFTECHKVKQIWHGFAQTL